MIFFTECIDRIGVITWGGWVDCYSNIIVTLMAEAGNTYQL